MPVKTCRPQVIVMGEKVYMGGGETEGVKDYRQVFQYDPSQDTWSHLPSHHVIAFGMAAFAGNLVTVGGVIPDDGGATSKVYHFKEQSQRWEEFVRPMPTARAQPSVATTQSAIVASGGVTGFRDDNKAVTCVAVEVYSSESSQWHTAHSLPVPCWGMSSVTIADTWYQLGGTSTDGNFVPIVKYTSLSILIQKATLPSHVSGSHLSVWNTLPDTPLTASAAVSLSGSLVAIGGGEEKTGVSPAVYVFFPFINSWIRATGNLPEPRRVSTAVQLSSNQVLVVGGYDNQGKYTKTVYQGSITIYNS